LPWANCDRWWRWWDDEVFLGLARLRGMECRSRYAEAFHCPKVALSLR
jgi:hypothetical protein